MISEITKKAIALLKDLIETSSFSGEEEGTAVIIEQWLVNNKLSFQRENNNIWIKNRYFDSHKPSILLNSHHDTVKPNLGYTKDPFKVEASDGKIYGLGSNDAGASLVSLIAAFTYFYNSENLKYNLVLLASAEEENSGPHGIRSVIPKLPEIDFAIVGEPTSMQLAIAEKGLLVLDCYAHGEAGHAAHGVGDNSIYKAMKDISWFENYKFPRISKTLGEVKMTVTQINAGKQHNVIPATCHFVVDVRTTDKYSNIEALKIINENVDVEVKERSLLKNSSFIAIDHPIVKAGQKLNREIYGSPTLSDQANLDCPSLKMGPGDSLRSHTADEFIYVKDIEEGIKIYIDLLKNVIV